MSDEYHVEYLNESDDDTFNRKLQKLYKRGYRTVGHSVSTNKYNSRIISAILEKKRTPEEPEKTVSLSENSIISIDLNH